MGKEYLKSVNDVTFINYYVTSEVFYCRNFVLLRITFI